MLALGARTGYEIKNAVDRSTRFFWAASYGQIYPELRRLEAARGWSGKSLPQAAGRDGSSRSHEERASRARPVGWPWRLEMPELPRQSLLKLFFADAPARASARAVAAAALGHEQFLAILREIDARPGDDPPFVDLVLRYGIAYGEFNVAWCAEQEARLRGDSREAA